MVDGSGGGFQRLLSPNQTTVMVVLLLGLWLLLGCGNYKRFLQKLSSSHVKAVFYIWKHRISLQSLKISREKSLYGFYFHFLKIHAY